MITTVFGWISAIAFGICAIPQAYKSHKEGHADGISNGLLFLWTIGEWSGIIYAIGLKEIPLLLNYSANALFIGIVTFYKLFPRRNK
jgi:uncharacterized protein with PQ loop repeat